MWIVHFWNGQSHSAWNTEKEALRQAETLIDKGIAGNRHRINPADLVHYDETVCCENGHYYV